VRVAFFYGQRKYARRYKSDQPHGQEIQAGCRPAGYNHMHALTRIDTQTPLCSALTEESFCQSTFLARTIYDQNSEVTIDNDRRTLHEQSCTGHKGWYMLKQKKAYAK